MGDRLPGRLLGDRPHFRPGDEPPGRARGWWGYGGPRRLGGAPGRPADAQLAKIVLVAGSNAFKPGEHEYVGGCAVLMDLLRQTSGVFPVLAPDWPKQPETFAGARAVERAKRRLATLAQAMSKTNPTAPSITRRIC